MNAGLGEKYAGDGRLGLPRPMRADAGPADKVGPRPLVDCLMEDIRGEVTDNHEVFTKLELRLAGVMGPQPPEEGGAPAQAAESVSELATKLSEVKYALRQMGRRIHQVLGRLEV